MFNNLVIKENEVRSAKKYRNTFQRSLDILDPGEGTKVENICKMWKTEG